MRANIKLSLTRLNPANLFSLATNVVSKMENNTNFSNPLIPLDLITNKSKELSTAITNTQDGNKLSRIIRDEIINELRLLLRTQADYVRSVCRGDASKLISSGFPLAKSPEKPGIPESPIIKDSVMTGIEGQVKLRWTGQKNIRTYQIWMTDKDPENSDDWQIIGSSTRISKLIDNLDSFKVYWFSVSAISSAGEGPKSNPVRGIAS